MRVAVEELVMSSLKPLWEREVNIWSEKGASNLRLLLNERDGVINLDVTDSSLCSLPVDLHIAPRIFGMRLEQLLCLSQ